MHPGDICLVLVPFDVAGHEVPVDNAPAAFAGAFVVASILPPSTAALGTVYQKRFHYSPAQALSPHHSAGVIEVCRVWMGSRALALVLLGILPVAVRVQKRGVLPMATKARWPALTG